jgi:NADPH:quinone reductase-like Zn-dependent oxidoreductase
MAERIAVDERALLVIPTTMPKASAAAHHVSYASSKLALHRLAAPAQSGHLQGHPHWNEWNTGGQSLQNPAKFHTSASALNGNGCCCTCAT